VPELDLEHRGEKIGLRLWTLGFWTQETILDLYAGEGNLSRLYAPYCRKLVCVEKDEGAFKRLEETLQADNVELHNCDNMEYLEEFDEPEVTFVDFDAFGCPNTQIAKFFEKHIVTKAVMVNVTDGSLLNLQRGANIDLEKHYLLNLFPRERLGDRDLAAKRGLRRLLPWLVETFVHSLAARYGFSTHFVYHAMSDRSNVLYYGFIAYPETSTSLWATGKTPVLRFKRDVRVPVKTMRKHLKT
jgi:hypothetical protein